MSSTPRTIVVKLGGSALQTPGTLRELSTLVRGLKSQGNEVVIVHGGGPAINQVLVAKGIQWIFIRGQRQTTPEMIDIIEDVLANQVNSFVVSSLHAGDVQAIGLSGVRDQILFCTQASAELMQVGKVESVNITAIEKALSQGLTPVVAPVGFGADGEKYNINADFAAAQIAIAMNAEQLVFLTDQDGVLDGERRAMAHITPAVMSAMIDSGVIAGGMHAKAVTMMTALSKGVGQVRVFNAAHSSHVLENPNLGTRLVEDVHGLAI